MGALWPSPSLPLQLAISRVNEGRAGRHTYIMDNNRLAFMFDQPSNCILGINCDAVLFIELVAGTREGVEGASMIHKGVGDGRISWSGSGC